MKIQSAFLRALLLLAIPGFLAHADEAKNDLAAKKIQA